MTDSKKVLGQKQKQKQRQTQRQTVVVNIGETARKRKRAPRKPKSQPPQAPRIIQQFIPQYAPLPDYGQIQRLVQSEIRMLEPPKTMRIDEFQERRLELLRDLALMRQEAEQEKMERGSIEEDIELIKKQAQADQAPIASTSGLQPISTDRQPLINQTLNAPVRLADDSPSPVLSLDNRPMEIEAAERIVKGNKMKRSQSVPAPKSEVFAVMEVIPPVVLPKGKGKAKIVVKNEEESPAATAASSSRGRPMTKKQQKAQEKRAALIQQTLQND